MSNSFRLQMNRSNIEKASKWELHNENVFCLILLLTTIFCVIGTRHRKKFHLFTYVHSRKLRTFNNSQTLLRVEGGRIPVKLPLQLLTNVPFRCISNIESRTVIKWTVCASYESQKIKNCHLFIQRKIIIVSYSFWFQMTLLLLRSVTPSFHFQARKNI